MDATTLKLPEGAIVAQHIDGMREIAMYDIASDCIKFRWDTLIGGKQATHFEYMTAYGKDISFSKFAESHRAIAKANFEAQEKAFAR